MSRGSTWWTWPIAWTPGCPAPAVRPTRYSPPAPLVVAVGGISINLVQGYFKIVLRVQKSDFKITVGGLWEGGECGGGMAAWSPCNCVCGVWGGGGVPAARTLILACPHTKTSLPSHPQAHPHLCPGPVHALPLSRPPHLTPDAQALPSPLMGWHLRPSPPQTLPRLGLVLEPPPKALPRLGLVPSPLPSPCHPRHYPLLMGWHLRPPLPLPELVPEP